MSTDLLQSTLVDLMSGSYLQETLHAENKLCEIIEHSVDGVVVVDYEGYLVTWNQSQAQITGVVADQALGKPIWDIIYALTPSHRQHALFYDRLRERFLSALQSGDSAGLHPSLEVEIERPSGELRVVQQSTFVLTSNDCPRLVCVFRDVTVLRQTTRNLQRRNTELNLLNRINRVLASSLDLEQVQRAILKEVVQLLDVTGASIWLVDEANCDLVCVQSLSHTRDPIPNAALLMWKSLADSVVYNRRTCVSQDAAKHKLAPNPNATDGFPGVRSFVCVPMQFRNSILGVLLCVDERPKRFSETDADILESIAASAATAFENDYLRHKAQDLAVLQERQRLAIGLHETINQSLFSAGLIATALPRLVEREPVQAGYAMQQLRKLLNEAEHELRQVLVEMQPAQADHGGFDSLLRQMVAEYTGRTGTIATINITNTAIVSAQTQEVLCRMCREIFTNIAKHAEATRVWVDMTQECGCVAIAIRDNGRGFDPRQMRAGHFGLSMLQQQAAKIGAELHTTSAIGQGTEIRIVVPDTTA